MDVPTLRTGQQQPQTIPAPPPPPPAGWISNASKQKDFQQAAQPTWSSNASQQGWAGQQGLTGQQQGFTGQQQGFSGQQQGFTGQQQSFPAPLQQQSGLQSGLQQSGLQSGLQQPSLQAAPPTWNAGGPEMFPEKRVTEATTVERQEREPILRETIIPQERIEVQPVIHREREVLELHQVTQPVYEKEVRATKIESTELPAEYREKIEGSQAEFQERLREGLEGLHSSVKWENVERNVIDQTPIIHETIKKIVREEVQQVIYREVIEPRVIKETLPIYERVVEAPRVFRQEREPVFKDFPRESFRAFNQQQSFSGVGPNLNLAPGMQMNQQQGYSGSYGSGLGQGYAGQGYSGQGYSGQSYAQTGAGANLGPVGAGIGTSAGQGYAQSGAGAHLGPANAGISGGASRGGAASSAGANLGPVGAGISGGAGQGGAGTGVGAHVGPVGVGVGAGAGKQQNPENISSQTAMSGR